MKKDFRETIKHRRTYYKISSKSLISDEQIEEIIQFALTYVPSAFNSQSTRIVLLLGKHHQKLWNIVKEELRKVTSEKNFPKTEEKVNLSFAAGYGTVLFFEDQSVVQNLQQNFPLYKDVFPIWSQHTTAMHQFTVWTLLEDARFGASLQHYHPLIDDAVCKEWKLDPKWKLTAQMPFGVPTEEPGKKEMQPLEERMKVFK